MIGLVHSTKYIHPTPETITYQEGLIIPFYLVAELMDISPWDGEVNDDIFSTEIKGDIRTDAIYTKGKSNVYKHEVEGRLGKQAYYQVGTVPRKNRRDYTSVVESFSPGTLQILQYRQK